MAGPLARLLTLKPEGWLLPKWDAETPVPRRGHCCFSATRPPSADAEGSARARITSEAFFHRRLETHTLLQLHGYLILRFLGTRAIIQD